MKLRGVPSIIAIDPMNRGLAYVFIHRGALLDFGARWLRGKADLTSVVDGLVDGCAVELVLLEDPRSARCLLGARARKRIRDIAKHLRRRGVGFDLLDREEVRRAWRREGFNNRQVIAAAIASRFGDLQPLLPVRRKVFETESDHMHVFDAMTLVLHRFSSVRELLER